MTAQAVDAEHYERALRVELASPNVSSENPFQARGVAHCACGAERNATRGGYSSNIAIGLAIEAARAALYEQHFWPDGEPPDSGGA